MQERIESKKGFGIKVKNLEDTESLASTITKK